jgi:hypothetical protein
MGGEGRDPEPSPADMLDWIHEMRRQAAVVDEIASTRSWTRVPGLPEEPGTIARIREVIREMRSLEALLRHWPTLPENGCGENGS